MDKVVVDVREPFEFAEGHVRGALNIPPDRLMNGATVYCRTGSRSNVAMHLLGQLGYTNIKNGINKDQVEARFLNQD
jgi:phage shock protein E